MAGLLNRATSPLHEQATSAGRPDSQECPAGTKKRAQKSSDESRFGGLFFLNRDWREKRESSQEKCESLHIIESEWDVI